MTHTSTDLFLAGSAASVTMTYRDMAWGLGLTDPVLEAVRLGTSSGEIYQFDADLKPVSTDHITDSQNITAPVLLYQTLKDIVDRNDAETKPYLKLTATASHLLCSAFGMLEKPVVAPKPD